MHVNNFTASQVFRLTRYHSIIYNCIVILYSARNRVKRFTASQVFQLTLSTTLLGKEQDDHSKHCLTRMTVLHAHARMPPACLPALKPKSHDEPNAGRATVKAEPSLAAREEVGSTTMGG